MMLKVNKNQYVDTDKVSILNLTGSSNWLTIDNGRQVSIETEYLEAVKLAFITEDAVDEFIKSIEGRN